MFRRSRLIWFLLVSSFLLLGGCGSSGGGSSSTTSGTTVGVGAAGNPALVNATVYIFGKNWDGTITPSKAIGRGETDGAGYASITVTSPSDGPPYYIVVTDAKIYNGTQFVDANGTYYGFFLKTLTSNASMAVSSLTTMAFLDANSTLGGALSSANASQTLNSTANRVANLFSGLLTDNGTLLDVTTTLPIIPPHVDNATVEKIKRYRMVNDLLASMIEQKLGVQPETENFVLKLKELSPEQNATTIQSWAQNATLITQTWTKVKDALQTETQEADRSIASDVLTNATLLINNQPISLDNATEVGSNITHLIPTVISGVVADGYVANATLTVYKSPEFLPENIVGNGTTDSNGNFNIVLSPDYNSSATNGTLYIRTSGGVLVDTGMSAPIMFFAGNETNGTYNITPLTDLVFKNVLKVNNLTQAQEAVANATQLTTQEIYGNPVTNPTANSGVKKVLSAKMLNTSLAPGNYTFYLIYYTNGDIEDNASLSSLADVENRIVKLPVTVQKDGEVLHITGNTNNVDIDYDGQLDQVEVEGWMVGGSLVINVEKGIDGEDGMMLLSGTAGMMGSFSGRMRVIENDEGGNEEPGVFAGVFMPESITASQRDRLFEDLTEITQGDSYLIYHQVLMTEPETPSMGYGTISLEGKEDNTGFNYNNFSIWDAEYNDTGNGLETPQILNNQSGTDFDYAEVDGNRIPLLVLPFQVTDDEDNSTIHVYLIVPAGSGSGIYVAAENDHVDDAGGVVLSNQNSTLPMWQGGKTYAMAEAAIGFHVLSRGQQVNGIPVNNSRTDAQGIVQLGFNSTSSPDYLTMPVMSSGSNASILDDEIYVFCGRTMVDIFDPDGDFNDSPNATSEGDFDLFIKKYETGALTGDYLMGGSIPWANNTVKDLYTMPASVVAFASVNGTTPPEFTGKMDFVTRSINGGGVVDEIPVFTRGDLTIDTGEGNGTMHISYIDSDNYNCSVDNIPLHVERLANTGLLHIYTDNVSYSIAGLNRNISWDIYWPIGAPKGIYFFSIEDSTGTLRVNEIGNIFVGF